MKTDQKSNISNILFQVEDFFVGSLEDEIAVDERCSRLLRIFCQDLAGRQGLSAEEAGRKAQGADYFLRDFVVADRRLNIFEVTGHEVTAFAGNWYIVKNLEPNLRELSDILDGVESFYRFCLSMGKIEEERLAELTTACARLDYYRQRIEDFWAITDDGYFPWNAACPVKR
jgi:hypothetical protein